MHSTLGDIPEALRNKFSSCISGPTSVIPTSASPTVPPVNATVSNVSDVNALPANVIGIKTDDCTTDSNTELDLSRFTNLQTFIVGDECFTNVEKLIISGLPKLEYVLIGRNSFKAETASEVVIPNSHFTLTGCNSMKEVRIGDESFRYYALCNITDSSIEIIHMGSTGDDSNSFYFGSLILKGATKRMD